MNLFFHNYIFCFLNKKDKENQILIWEMGLNEIKSAMGLNQQFLTKWMNKKTQIFQNLILNLNIKTT